MYKFTHLRLHTEYSIVDSLVKINEIIKLAKKDKQESLAITDLSNIFGAIKFYKESIKNGIKPIIGCDLFIENKINKKKPFRLLILSKNYNGYLQLCKLISKSWIYNLKDEKPQIKKSWLKKINKNSNLIALSGYKSSDLLFYINKKKFKKAENCAKKWKKIFNNLYFIEIQNINIKNNEIFNYNLIKIGNKLNIPIVATHPIQFCYKKEFIAHEIRYNIYKKKKLNNSKYHFNKEQNFKTQIEINKLFVNNLIAVKNSYKISKMCNLIIPKGVLKLPKYNKKKKINDNELLKIKTKIGLNKRLKNKKNLKIYKKRLKFELKIISKTNFSNYFLMVNDFIKWAKKKNINIGPGRGSGASSLIAYCLFITDIDPIKYKLIFERFLNPERISFPDFDIDFCQKKRDIIIKYIKKKYGVNNVSQIITFGKIAAKSSIRDVGRVLGLSYNFCNNIVKLISNKKYYNLNLKEIVENNYFLKKKILNNKIIKKLIFFSIQIEGIIKNIGIHAGGILISKNNLNKYCALYKHSKDNIITIQNDKEDLEFLGLIKFDFLGLATLTIIDETNKNIKKINPKIKLISWNKISFKDKKTYKLLNNANTIGVFQLESIGIQNILKKANINCLEDITAIISLYRPGPIKLIKKFYKRKNGYKFKFFNEKIKNVLSETYGIMIYQEQVMEVAKIIANYSMGSADLLRRIISKKNLKEMHKNRKLFIKGALKNKINLKTANKIFNLMEKFAGYGFNKSHATAYAVISYYTAYLKSNFPNEFISANLSLSINNINKIKFLIKDAINNFKINILPPNINYSKYKFIPIIKNNIFYIRYGLSAIKGLGKIAIKLILNKRKKKIFKNLYDFIFRIIKNKNLINKRVLNSLIYSGSLDIFNKNRNILKIKIKFLLKNLNDFNKKLIIKNKNKLNILKWKKKILNKKKILEKQKFFLGFYLFKNPFFYIKKDIEQLNKFKIYNINKFINKNIITYGIINNIKKEFINNKEYFVINIENKKNNINCIIKNNLYKKNKNFIRLEKKILLEGKVIKKNYNFFQINVKNIFNISKFRKKFILYISIYIKNIKIIKKIKYILNLFINKKGKNVFLIKIKNNKIIKKYFFKKKIKFNNKLLYLLKNEIKNKFIRIKYKF
ncbi:putative DNA polymerase III, alpha subunit [Candidatus Zinderia insecticola CARI]|uniref:DNA polymerase III subunit alpha n=1 Tax=Zinderia insecticola (strain CARI) TaxID=871271 RepID=E0TIP0_ZINIC|nr:putative DNA polymerase III, alpha subunit [Candidatus Zinderia insecticola CARI]